MRSFSNVILLAVGLVGCGGSTQPSSDAGGSGGNPGDAASDATVLSPRCLLPQQVGPCDALVRAYWHNPATGVCEPFVYGGCEGNDNRFASLVECQTSCHGGLPNMDACHAPADCMLAPVGCCAQCDPVDARAFTAIHRANAMAYTDAKGCTGVGCGPCHDVPPLERTSQYFTATCSASECSVVDIRETDITSCQRDEDCKLRLGADCCERCAGEGVVALNSFAQLSKLVCGDETHACPACAPIIPPQYMAKCPAGRCAVMLGQAP